MRFEVDGVDGVTAVITKEDDYSRIRGVTHYVIYLFKDDVERDSLYVTVLDVTNKEKIIKILKREIAAHLAPRKSKGGQRNKLL